MHNASSLGRQPERNDFWGIRCDSRAWRTSSCIRSIPLQALVTASIDVEVESKNVVAEAEVRTTILAASSPKDSETEAAVPNILVICNKGPWWPQRATRRRRNTNIPV